MPRDFKPQSDTLAILDQNKKEPGSKVSIPSKRAVTEAKEWVDEHQL